MNDSIESAKLAARHFEKRVHEEFGDDAIIVNATVVNNEVNVCVSIPNEWEPLTQDILKKLQCEMHEIMNQGLA